MAWPQILIASITVIPHAMITGPQHPICAIVLTMALVSLVVQRTVQKLHSLTATKIVSRMVVVPTTALLSVNCVSSIIRAGSQLMTMVEQQTSLVGTTDTHNAKPSWDPLQISAIALSIRNVF
jgi:hypothetical protein